MRVDKRLIGVKGDECQCGRRATIRHCTACGSPRVYARMNRVHEFVNGESKYVAIQYRCQTCGHLFIEEEREFCEAPPVSTALAQQKIKAIHDASQQGEYLRPDEARIAESLKALIQTNEDPKKAFDRLVYQLRIEYVDRKASGEVMKLSMDEHVEMRLKELDIKPPAKGEAIVVPQTLAALVTPPVDDSQPDSVPIEERSIRLEWGRKKLAGRVVPDIEDYVRRRLAGELFE